MVYKTNFRDLSICLEIKRYVRLSKKMNVIDHKPLNLFVVPKDDSYTCSHLRYKKVLKLPSLPLRQAIINHIQPV